MGMSGIEPEQTLKEEFHNMQQNKLVPPIELLVMQISDDKTKVIKAPDLCKEKCSHAQLMEFFSDPDNKNKCFYAVFDYESKLFLIKWTPDTSKVTEKMLYGSSFETLKTAFGSGIKASVQATDLDDLKLSDFKSLLKK